jgi:hypothetical protein
MTTNMVVLVVVRVVFSKRKLVALEEVLQVAASVVFPKSKSVELEIVVPLAVKVVFLNCEVGLTKLMLLATMATFPPLKPLTRDFMRHARPGWEATVSEFGQRISSTDMSPAKEFWKLLKSSILI